MKNTKVPAGLATAIIVGLAGSITWYEARALDKLDHPPLRKISCVSCHMSEKSMKAMADKAGDDLYLVHRGDMKASPNGAPGRK